MATGTSVDLIENGWFIEKNDQWPGQANALQVKKVLEHKKTQFQDLLVFESTHFGNVIVLDGVIQITERDEASYQEMMAHLPMFSVKDPKQVLLIGGGDGGVLREVVKHPSIEKVTMCEIDGDVVEASKKYLPNVSCGFSHPKANLIIGNGVEFVQKASEASYDVVIVDSSDPVGPAEKLFSKEFYNDVLRVLKPGGVICSQGECLWNNEDLIATMVTDFGAPFCSAEYASIQVPTYPCGQIGAFLARKAGSSETSCRKPLSSPPEGMTLRYYSSELHEASFALPAFMKEKLEATKSGSLKRKAID